MTGIALSMPVQRFQIYESEILRFALDGAGGVVTRAAALLGIGRATFYRKMRRYGIEAPPMAERRIVRGGKRKLLFNEDQLALRGIR